MRNYKFTFMAICYAAAMTACGKIENSEPTPGPEPAPESNVTLYGSLGETAKTYLNPTTDNENQCEFKVLWEKNDAIAISKDGNNNYATYYTLAESGNEKVRFDKKSGDNLGGTDEFDAFYPASLVDAEGNLQWPAEQRYGVISGDNPGAVGNNPMWAHAKLQDNRAEMQFYNLGGVIRFKLSQPTEPFNVVMAMISADQPLSGQFELNGESSAPIVTMKNRQPNGIYIMPENKVQIATSGEASFYFAVPAGTYRDVKITLIGDNGKKVTARLGEGKTLAVERANVVRLAAKGITPGIDGSNCFIGEGDVPIVITTMGNAFDGETALDGNDSRAVWKAIGSNAQGCRIVWETENTATAPADNTIIKSATFANGILTVIPTGTPGNALVAITDGANGSGNIVWSYHIWVPETTIGHSSVVNGNGKFVFLDRNLGALKVADPNVPNNTKSIGLQYQWGRKDPLLGYADFTNDLKVTMNGNTKVNTSFHSLKLSIESPDYLIGTAENDRYTNEGLTQLWGWTEGNNLNEATLNKKSIYDPCPEGYRVPGDSEYIKALGSGTNSIARTSTNNVIKITSYPNMTFPYTGEIYPYGTNERKQSSNPFVWTAVNRPGKNVAWHLNLYNSTMCVGNGAASADGEFEGNAANVRCIKDASTSADGYSLTEINHEYINFFE